MASLSSQSNMPRQGSKALVLTAGDGIFQTGHIVYTVVSMLSMLLMAVLLSESNDYLPSYII